MKYIKLFKESLENKIWYHGSNFNFNNFQLKFGSFLDKDYINPIFFVK